MSTEDEIKKLAARLNEGDYPEEVVNALVSYGERALLPVLKAFQSPTARYMANNAGCVLVGIGQPAVAPLIELLRQGKTGFSTASTLGYLGDRSAVEPLIVASHDKEQYMRWAAVRALGLLGDVRAIDAVVKRLKDRSSMVRFAAVTALKELGDLRAIEPLLAVANNPKSPVGTKSEALAAIAEIEARLQKA